MYIKNDLQHLVAQLLHKFETLRDDDKALVCNVWIRELHAKGKDYRKMSAVELLEWVKSGDLTNSDRITRTRRKLQEHSAALRGKKYNKRHANTQQVKSELGYAQT